MTEAEAAVVRELINAAEAKMEAMFNSDLEASWRRHSERWGAACEAAYLLPGVDPEKS